VLEQWSATHGLPADSSSSWRGLSIHHLQQLNSSSSSNAQTATLQQQQCGFAPASDQALLSLKEAVQRLQQQQQQQQYETICAADSEALGSGSSSSSLWGDLAEDVPHLLRADSLQQLEAVLGPEGEDNTLHRVIVEKLLQPVWLPVLWVFCMDAQINP
jgi:hypothetical protein